MSIERSGRNTRRSSILRGVYEDNLGIERRRAAPGRWRTGAAVSSGAEAERTRQPGLRAVAAALVVLVALGSAGMGYLAFGFGAQAPAEQNARAAPQEVTSEQAAAEQATTREEAGLLGPAAPTVLRSGAAEAPLSPAGLSLAHLFGLEVQTIVIDPGHGGRMPGAVGPTGLLEKDVALDVALRLKRRLEARGDYRVLMTRTGDEHVSLQGRVAFANAREADLFISIHINWLPVESVTSIETYYFGAPTDARTLRMAERENRNSDYTVAEFNEMLDDVGQTMRLEESKRLAASIQRSVYRNIHQLNPDVENWGVKTAPFVVLLGADAPSVLAEIGVISNRAQEEKLRAPAYREKLAAYLDEGITRYLNTRFGRGPAARALANASSNY